LACNGLLGINHGDARVVPRSLGFLKLLKKAVFFSFDFDLALSISIDLPTIMRGLSILAAACTLSCAAAQTFQRLGGCPDLGCVFPPDQYVFRSERQTQATNKS
jgi:hypothetical protein